MSEVTWVNILLNRKELLQNGIGQIPKTDQQVTSCIIMIVF